MEVLNLTKNAEEVLYRRYLKKDEKGNVIEKPEDMFHRVAHTIASADAQYVMQPANNVDEAVKETEEQFYDMMARLDFLPNSPTLMNAGRPLGQLSACFVLPIEDTMVDIFESVKNAALIHKSGGGTGFSFSRIRSKGTRVSTTGGVASGPISFMRAFDAATGTVAQGGTRRGANMGMLRVDHPDIMEFITVKNDLTTLNNFNISVAITDKFMDALKRDAYYDLVDPHTKEVTGQLKAKDVFDAIVDSAWRTGEPGVVFIDKMNKHNVLAPIYGEIESTNPCVAGWTKITTDQGDVEIRDVVGREVNVWNGETYSKVTPKITGTDQPTLIITFDNGEQLFCTLYHKFIMADGTRIEARYLKLGDQLGAWKCPDGTTNTAAVTEITQGPILDKVYCFTEPLRHAGMFNHIVTANCGEQPLLPYEACNLGSINLANHVTCMDKTIGTFVVDYEHLEKTVRMAVHFLDNVIDVNKYPLPEIDKMTRSTRKIGLGVMGWADMLLKLGIPYNSDDAVALGATVMQFIDNTASDASKELGKERGAFPAAKDLMLTTPKRRNATVTTIAPTGSLSIIAGVSSGIEPNFGYVYYKNVMDNDKLPVVNPILDGAFDRYGITGEKRAAIMDKIAEQGTLAHIDEIPESIRKVFVSAHDITPKYHVYMQSAFQRYVDNAVSKTVNFTEDATRGDIAETYWKAYESYCKGITVYRNGSRQNQVLNLGKVKETTGQPAATADVAQDAMELPHDLHPRKRSDDTFGITHMTKINCGKLYTTVNADEYGICEVFTSNGKSGGCSAQTEAVARMISLALRSGVCIDDVIRQLRGIRCDACLRNKNISVLSCPDAIARQLDRARHMNWLVQSGGLEATSEAESTPPVRGDNASITTQVCSVEETTDSDDSSLKCPQCGAEMEHSGGCPVCRKCGWSRCG